MLRWHKNHSRLNTLEKNTRMRMRVACSADIKLRRKNTKEKNRNSSRKETGLAVLLVFWNWLLLPSNKQSIQYANTAESCCQRIRIDKKESQNLEDDPFISS